MTVRQHSDKRPNTNPGPLLIGDGHKALLYLLSGALLLTAGLAAGADVEQVVYIEAGAQWRYFKGTQEPPTGWNQVNFNDQAWLQGPTGIGYGDGDDATVLNDMRGNYLTVYLRRKFQVPEPAFVLSLSLQVTYDDGFAAYLNGREVARENLPAQSSFDTSALSAGEPTTVTVNLSPYLEDLLAGENVLAIEVHNANSNSSDLSMIPVLKGTVVTGLVRFTRGDVNTDGLVNVSDVVSALQYLFEDGPQPGCPDTADINDDGKLNILDPVYLLANLFVGGPDIPEPQDCGFDPTFKDERPPLDECDYPLCQ